MNKILFFVITILFLIGCNSKNDLSNSNIKKVDYILCDSISSQMYSEQEGYKPNEGLVPTPEVAFKIAKTILIEIYGEETIESEMPFLITLENGIWLLQGNYKKEGITFGGEAYIEIRKSNGEILKVVHTE